MGNGINKATAISLALHAAFFAAFAAPASHRVSEPPPVILTLVERPAPQVIQGPVESEPALLQPQESASAVEESHIVPKRLSRRSSPRSIPAPQGEAQADKPTNETAAISPIEGQPAASKGVNGPSTFVVGVGERAREPSVSLWIDLVEEKLRQRGERLFPSKDGKTLYGVPVVSIEVSKDGRLVAASIKRSSGDESLDEAALRIVEASSPFAPLPKEIEGNIKLDRRLAFQKG